jgi:hypothetical protein
MKNVGEFQVVRSKVYKIEYRPPWSGDCGGCAGKHDGNTCFSLGGCHGKIAKQIKPKMILYSMGWVCLCNAYVGIGDTPQLAYADWLSRYKPTTTS